MATERKALSEDGIADRLHAVPLWRRDGNYIKRSFEFETFPLAFGFMSAVATEAQALNHHPDWENSYTLVSIRLCSHDVGRLSERDFSLAEKIDSIAKHFGGTDRK